MSGSEPIRRGAVIIINNLGDENDDTGRFKRGENNHFRYRQGSDRDHDNLQAIFQHTFGFQWINASPHYITFNVRLFHLDHGRNPMLLEVEREPKPNKTDPLQCCLRCLIHHYDFSHIDCLVFAVSTHGLHRNGVLNIQSINYDREEYVPLPDILKWLEENPGLKGKVKILIVNASRQEENVRREDDSGMPINTISLGDASTTASQQRQHERRAEDYDDTLPFIGATVSQRYSTMPVHQVRPLFPVYEEDKPMAPLNLSKDTIVVYATTPNRVARSNSLTGSWLIHALRTVIDGHQGPTVDFLQILTKTARQVALQSTLVYKKQQDDYGQVFYERNASAAPIPDEKRSGGKNAICIEHRLCRRVLLAKTRPDH
ncbi:uncharacterized protein LOC127844556 isoform X3 [Dreissena polymorpha]|nr:uncharacterized protein LOC127844556 isoform X3 [Dreissena polymorpha]